jgi:hypothetical protein
MTVPVTKQNNNATMNHRAVMLSRRGSVVERSWTPKWRGMAADPDSRASVPYMVARLQ